MHEFYDETKPVYIEMDASGVGQEVALPQTRNGTSYPRDEAPHNSILRPIVFMNKSIWSMKKDSVT